MAKSNYDILDPIARRLNDMQDGIASISAEFGNFYPDNSRDGDYERLTEFVDFLIADAKRFRDSLPTIRPDSGPDNGFDRVADILAHAPNSEWHYEK